MRDLPLIFFQDTIKRRLACLNKPEMVNAPEGLNKVILRKIKRFDCKTNQVASKQLASS